MEDASILVALNRLALDLDQLGVATQLAGKVVGGVVLTPLYYEHALACEGRVSSGLPADTKLLFSKAAGGGAGGITLVPANEEALQAGGESLPREAPVLGKLMSAAAISAFRWGRVPSVAVLGCLVMDDEFLEAAAANGVPVSPSMTGPHAAELQTQLEVFFKQHKYPENKAFVLRDWGFVVFGATVEEATATFEGGVRSHLAPIEEEPALFGDGGALGAGDGAVAGVARRVSGLAGAFRRLGSFMSSSRTQSEPADAASGSAGGAVFSPTVLSKFAPAGSAAAGALGTGGGAGPFSEPSSPMVGGGLLRGQFGSPPSSAALPDDIRKAPSVVRANNSECRIPSFQTGLKPW